MRKKGFMLMQVSIIFCSCISAHADTILIDRIIAVVNEEIITFSELNKFKSLMFMGMDKQKDGLEFDSKILMQMIDKKIIIQEAKNLEIEVKKKEIDMAIKNIMDKNKIDLKTLKESLAKQGTTLPEYRKLMEEEIIQSHVIGRQVQANITITDNDIKKYYEKNIKPKEKPGERVRLQQILLMIPKDTNQEKEQEILISINDIREKIVAGEDFGKLAVAHSHGPAAKMAGDLGYFHKGELMPAIEDAAFSMEKGELSPVITTPVGLHLIKLLDKDKTDKDRSWKDHIGEIEGALYNKLFDKNYTEWLTGIKEKAYIEINF